MRAFVLGLLLMLPTVAAGPIEEPVDLVVTLRAPFAPPNGAIALSLLDGFILLDASPATARALAADPRVERVDAARPLEFHGRPALPSSAFHSLTRANEGSLDGRGVTVAVVDSGVDATHPDLAGRVRANVKLVAGRFADSPGDFDGHGTHVAGVLAGSGQASGGRWRGVAPAAEIVGVDISGRFTTTSAILAYEWLAANRDEFHIRVVVNAWGRVPDGERYDPRDPLIRSIDRLVASGVVVLFSASNHGPSAGSISIEAMDPHVVTVGATDAAGLLASYSSRGPVAADEPWTKPDVVAPGDAVAGPRSAGVAPSIDAPDPLYLLYSGTSQAVPHVAGIVARLLQAEPSLRPEEVAHILRSTAIDLGPPGPDDETGHGLVDAADALAAARGRAPDRRNVLVVGGSDAHRDETTLAATARRGLLDIVREPQIVWETPFAVKAGARDVRVEARAEGAQGLAVELVKDGRVVRGAAVDAPEAGVWLARVRADLPVASRAEIFVESTLPPNPSRALQFDGRPPPAWTRPAGSDEASAIAWVAAPEHAPLLALALAGTLAAVALWPRRKKPSGEPVPAPSDK